jgi:hypothetical protein
VNRLSTTARAAIVAALVEGNSIRATCRMTGRDKETVSRLLADLGAACDIFQAGTLRDLPLQANRVRRDMGFRRGQEP